MILDNETCPFFPLSCNLLWLQTIPEGPQASGVCLGLWKGLQGGEKALYTKGGPSIGRRAQVGTIRWTWITLYKTVLFP